MNQTAEAYSMKEQSDYFRKFEQQLGGVENLTIGLWRSIITIHSVILGVSVGIMGYLKAPPNIFLKSAWIFMIISIGLGFFIFKLHIDQKTKGAWASLRFSMDINTFLLSDVKGEFIGKDEKKTGMFVAILMNQESDMGIPEKNRAKWTDYAKKLAKKHKAELQSSRLLLKDKKTPVHTIKAFFLRINPKLITAFYISSFLAFLALLLSILT